MNCNSNWIATLPKREINLLVANRDDAFDSYSCRSLFALPIFFKANDSCESLVMLMQIITNANVILLTLAHVLRRANAILSGA